MVYVPAAAELYVCACCLLAMLSTRSQGASLGFLSTGKSDIGVDLLSSLWPGHAAGDTDALVPAMPLSVPAHPHLSATDTAKTTGHGYSELGTTRLHEQQAAVRRKADSASQGLRTVQLLSAKLSLPVSPEKVLDPLKGIRIDKIKAKPKPLPVSKKTVPVPSSQSEEPQADPPSLNKDQRKPAAFNKASHLNVLPAAGFVPRRTKSGNGIKASANLGPDPAVAGDPPSAEQGGSDLAPKAPDIPAHGGSRGSVGAVAAAAVASAGAPPDADVVLVAGSEDPAVAVAAQASEQRMPCVMFPTNPPPLDSPQESSHLHVPYGGDTVPIPDEDGVATPPIADDEDKDAGGDDTSGRAPGTGDTSQEGNWNSQHSHSSYSSSQSQDDDDQQSASSSSASASSS